MSKLTQEAAQEIEKVYMTKALNYARSNGDAPMLTKKESMVFDKAKCSLVVYEMYAQGEIDERERDYYLERAIYIKGHQHFRKHILMHTAASRKERQKKFTENMDKAEFVTETKISIDNEQEKFNQVLAEHSARVLANDGYDAAIFMGEKATRDALLNGYTKARINLEHEVEVYKKQIYKKKKEKKKEKEVSYKESERPSTLTSYQRTSYQQPQSNFIADGLRWTFMRFIYIGIFIFILFILYTIFG